VVAYADEKYGEVGTIYQACNAMYLGMTDPKGQADYVIRGKRMSAWVVRKKYGTRDRRKLRRIDSRVRILPLRRKHRYLLVAGSSRFRRRVGELLESHLRAYPKRLRDNPQPLSAMGKNTDLAFHAASIKKS
jgi:hypothetical protein